jgi:4-carboxymuconolactone decarboxylase
MSDAQRAVFDAVVSGPRGTVVGPLRAALHSPELADRWSKLGEFIRYKTMLPAKLNELAILVTARRWNSELEWVVHSEAARAAGLEEDLIQDLLHGRPPRISDGDTAAIYEFARQIQLNGQVDDAAYEAVRSRWQERGVVELTAVIGYYTMVSMTLNAHRIPLPDGMEPDLHAEGEMSTTLTTIPMAGTPGVQ